MLSWIGRFATSSIGKKTIMALTGLALAGFLVVHLAGNLTLYGGDEEFNGYAEKLESYGWLLTAAEIALAALFVVHIALALRLARENAAARPQRYQVRSSMGRRTIGSATMVLTGLVVAVFVAIHVADFRAPMLAGGIDDLAAAVRTRLSSPLGAGIYLVGVTALGVHLSHALQSALQTLGLEHPRWTPVLRAAARALALVIALGFASFPIVLFLGGAQE